MLMRSVVDWMIVRHAWGHNSGVLQDELLAELEELEQEELDKQLLDTPSAKLPDVPVSEPPKAAVAKGFDDGKRCGHLCTYSNSFVSAKAKVPDMDADLRELEEWAS